MSNSENNFWQEIQKEISEKNNEAVPTQASSQMPMTGANNQSGRIQNNDMQINPETPHRLPFNSWDRGTPGLEDMYDIREASPMIMQTQDNQDNILSILKNNLGYYVVCDFLIGTERIETREGLLYSSGVNFLTLFHPQNRTYTVCDIYSLKFITFFNSMTVPPERAGVRMASAKSQSGKSSSRRFY